MNKERMLEWAEALESGEYRQGTGCLNRNGEFCCLGVACEIAVKHGVILPGETRNVWENGKVFYNGEAATLPIVVADWFGLPDNNPGYGDKAFTAMNDLDKMSFPKIAAQVRAMANLPERDQT